MSYNEQSAPRNNETYKIKKQGNPSSTGYAERDQASQQVSQRHNPQTGNVQGFPQQRTKAGDDPVNMPDDDQEPKQNQQNKASNAA